MFVHTRFNKRYLFMGSIIKRVNEYLSIIIYLIDKGLLFARFCKSCMAFFASFASFMELTLTALYRDWICVHEKKSVINWFTTNFIIFKSYTCISHRTWHVHVLHWTRKNRVCIIYNQISTYSVRTWPNYTEAGSQQIKHQIFLKF